MIAGGIPGLYGDTSATKWLERIDVSNSTDLPGFWAERGWDPDVTVHVVSRIDAPHNRSTVQASEAVLAGVARPAEPGAASAHHDDHSCR